MITLTNVAMEFGMQELYRDVTLLVESTDRIGLVGPNGSGKSTILKMMAGLERPTTGDVSIRRGVRIAYLPQTGAVVGERTVLEEAMSAFGHLEDVHRQMIECEDEMSCAELGEQELNALLRRYGALQQRYDVDGHDSEARAQKTLIELGFSQDDFDKDVKTQSGGFQVRLTLARMLLQEPDLLLLDEPTNYLDIRSIEWLQGYLKSFKGAFVMVAHDRYLLDGLVERVWAIENRGVRVFTGNYSTYLSDKAVRDDRQQKAYEEQQAFIKRTKTFIAKFKGRKDTAPRAMSRQKMLDKLELVEAPREEATIRIRFPEADEVHGRAFELKGVGRSFAGRRIFGGVDLAFKGGERIGLFGANGAGKTTLLRIIAGRLKPTEGAVWWSQKTQVAYYEQGAEEELDPDQTVLETVAEAAVGYTENELKGILGIFLFSGDAVEKRVSVLSGGERSRLAIISVLLTPSNLLILDEPTNHLDIRSREVLFDAIGRYKRTVVFAAHDRFMLDALADKTVLVEGGEAALFPGNYSYARSRSKAPVRRSPVSSAPGPVSSYGPRRKRTRKKQDAFDRVAELERRLAGARERYEAARGAFDLNRARELALEVKALEDEVARARAEQLADSTQGGDIPEAWT